MAKRKSPAIAKMQAKLIEHYHAAVLEKVMETLYNKGFTFDTNEDIHMFFRNRVKKHTDKVKNITNLFLEDGTPLCCYGGPEYKQKRNEITTTFKYTEL